MIPPNLMTFEHEPVGGAGRLCKVTVRYAGEVRHIDSIDLAKAKERDRFIACLKKRVPALDADEIHAKLLAIADRPVVAMPAVAPDEVDLRRIVRPELFITPWVTGLTVATPVMVGGKPAGKWAVYLRWPDGRRERVDLSGSINLDGGETLWLNPVPAAPNINASPGWSAAARAAWLGGKAAPDPALVLHSVLERIAHYLELPPDVAYGTAATLAVWSMLTYVYPAWDAVPYLFIGGPMGSGKTRAFEVLARLVFRPLGSSNMTAPALFRTLNERGGTLLMDEAERLKDGRPETGELLSIFLAGYKRGGRATRLEAVGDTFETREFDVFGPKALACIAGLPPTLSSRSIPIMMFRADDNSPKPRRKIDDDPAKWQTIRDDLHALALEYGQTWLDLSRRHEVCPSMSGRNAELWQPLLAIATWLEERGVRGLGDLLREHAMKCIDAGKEDQIPEVDEILLTILAARVMAGDPPTSSEILDRARLDEPELFRNYKTGKSVGTVLKRYGLVTRKSGDRRFSTVTKAMLRKIQQTYELDLGIPEPAPAPAVPSPRDGESVGALGALGASQSPNPGST
ncbi:MAG: hypothetical protein NTW19_11890 [Planctomycetota bacterium]|nr:hypothetical protein [Planctomycetota bacterium]